MSATFIPLKVLCSNELSVLAVAFNFYLGLTLEPGAMSKGFGLSGGDIDDVADPRFSKGLWERPLLRLVFCDESSAMSSLTSTSTSSIAGYCLLGD